MLVFHNFIHLVLGRGEKGRRKGGRRKSGKSYEWFVLCCMCLRVGVTFHGALVPVQVRGSTRFLTDLVHADRDPAAPLTKGGTYGIVIDLPYPRKHRNGRTQQLEISYRQSTVGVGCHHAWAVDHPFIILDYIPLKLGSPWKTRADPKKNY